MKNLLKKSLTLCLTLTLSITTFAFPVNSLTNDTNISNNSREKEEELIPDINLKQALMENMKKPISKENLSEVKELNLENKDITNIEGLQYCKTLKTLKLSSNEISDISQLKDLTSLNYLDLSSNEISDINLLEGLTSLKNLYLGLNKISDISSIKDLNSLISLSLYSNEISDISYLENLTSLTYLDINSNKISDISSLEGLTLIKELNLASNNISNISHLEKLTSINNLYLGSNKISDISSLEGLTSINNLDLSFNKINNIKTLGRLSSLNYLDISSNKINDISLLKELNSISTISANNQTIDLNSIILQTNEFKTETPIRLLNENKPALDEVSNIKPRGNYDVNGFINWTNLDRSGSLEYYFKHDIATKGTFSGKVIQNYEIVNKTNTAPKILGTKDKTIYVNDKYDPKEGVTAIDNEDGDLTDNIIISGTVDTSKAGKYDIKYSVMDSNKNEATAKIKVTVKTNTPPVIEGAVNKTIYVGDTFDPKEGVTAKDNEDGDLTANIIISGTVDASKAGNYNITYSVMDSDKNEATAKIKVTVKSKTSGGGGSTVDPDQKTVILASGEKYTDVLTATVLGHEKDAPILLTQKDKVDDKTLSEIKRLNTENIIISGGKDSVSKKVEDQLKNYNITRISGQDRYETAVKIGDEVRNITGNKTESMLVDGTNFPDVITISTLATQKRAPILLTEPKTFNNTTDKTMSEWGINNVTIGGSYDSVSRDIESSLSVNKVSRLGGADRYETAKLIATEVRGLTGNKSNMILVDGTNFPDGITINSLASNFKAPIMLTTPNTLSKETADKISEWSIKNVLIGGGYNSVSKNIEDNLGVSNKERVAGQDRYETAVKISERLSQTSKALGSK
ncbi:cell wall-binding repeat-containing protein [Metaclostridioides mangenotii]|uniref:cell wall-binding repeat-containing protein n=1 Tax=Metaclostridioides mangenotii TaxID=1540 RepID=UPI0026EAE110|nr:cell wall-binding repeat-containing protein [Clostridioides mangenotii]